LLSVQASSLPTHRKVLCAVYGAVAVAALVLTWANIGPYAHAPTDFLGTFWCDTKVNEASRLATADLLMLGLSTAILMVIEGRRYGVRFIWAYVVGGLLIAISAAFPLFLIARELRIGASEGQRLQRW
jgi:Terpene cyclase DEP1